MNSDLSKLNPLKWAPIWFIALYVGAIFTYAVAYNTLLAGDFVAPYTRYEPQFVGDLENVARIVENSLKQKLQDNEIIKGDVQVFARITDYNENSISMVISQHRTDFNFEDTSDFSLKIEFPKEIVYSNHRSNDPKMKDLGPDGKPWDTRDYECLFVTFGDFVGSPEEVSFFRPTIEALKKAELGQLCYHAWQGEGNFSFKRQDASAIKKTGLALSGKPTVISSNFGRMLYFSTVTIATLGYGDVVPVTEQARAVAASEAIFGWMIAGLFLNALSLNIGGNAKPRSEESDNPDE